MSELSEIVALRVVVSGDVQGVGYRQACRFQARSHNLSGWVRNRFDGKVEAFLQGGPDEVDQMLDWMWIGPPMAAVREVISDPVDVDRNLTDFFIAR